MFPLLHFTYADAQGNLPNLRKERKAHFEILVPHFLGQKFDFIQNVDFSSENLDFGFNNYLKEVTIFHFSGHADMGHIELQDGAAYIDGIAIQMKKLLEEKRKEDLSNLILVFLNGCSTAYMANLLLKGGVPVVIGTSTNIRDDLATQFSITFYQKLIAGHTLKQAFEDAEAKIRTVSNNIVIERGSRPANNSKKPLWGLFYNEEHYLDWHLHKKDEKSDTPRPSYEVNNIIKGALYHSLLKAGALNIQNLEERRKREEEIEEEINSNLLLGFPGPISNNLAQLLRIEIDHHALQREELLEKHLIHIYRIYQSLSELMFLIMLSQLWEICLANQPYQESDIISPQLPVDYRKISEELEIIKDFFTTTREERLYTDYLPKIRAIRKVFDKAGRNYFIDELEKLKNDLEHDRDFIACYLYFRNLQVDFKEGRYHHYQLKDWEVSCMEGEKHLSYFFQKISFCARYDFAILKNIELYLPRFKSFPSYTYRLLKIPKNGNTKYRAYAPVMDGFTSVKSVVMLKTDTILKGGESLRGQINLYPFLVDYNVDDLRADKGDLIIYSHFDCETKSYVFEEAFRDSAERRITLQEPLYHDLHASINAFVDVLFNESIESLNCLAHG